MIFKMIIENYTVTNKKKQTGTKYEVNSEASYYNLLKKDPFLEIDALSGKILLLHL